jgi:hypothetical protein
VRCFYTRPKGAAVTDGDKRGDRTLHRAAYVLERGIWRATCRECGFQVSDAQRRQAATQFRMHIQDMRDSIAHLAEHVRIDLRDRLTAVRDNEPDPVRG